MKVLFFSILFLFSYINTFAAELIISHGITLNEELMHKKDFKHFNKVNKDAPKTGTFKRALYGTYDNFNPFSIKGNNLKSIGYIYDKLLTVSLDETDSYYGLLAEELEYPTDYSFVKFTIRKNAYWHDKTPITADDVIFTFNEIMEKNLYFKNYYSFILSIEKISKYDVKFTFKKNMYNKKNIINIGQMFIIPKHYWKNKDLSKSTLEIPLGSGPYKIHKHDLGKTVVFKLVDDYWGKSLNVNIGINNFDKMFFEYFKDQTVAFEAFKVGHFDFIIENDLQRWNRGYNGKFFEKGYIKKETQKNSMPAGISGLFINTSIYPLNDINIRIALNYAFNYNWINNNVYFNEYTRYNSFFSNSDYTCGKPNRNVTKILKEFYPNNKDITNKEFIFPNGTNNRENLKKSLFYFNKAGFKLKNNKLVNKNNVQLILNIPIYTKMIDKELNYYKSLLNRIGVTLNILHVDLPQYQELVRKKDYSLLYSRIIQSSKPGLEQRYYYSSEYANQDFSQNMAMIRDKNIDTLLQKITDDSNKDYLKALDKLLLHNWIIIPFGYDNKIRISYWDKFLWPEGKKDVSVSTWWINTERENEFKKVIYK